MNEYIIVFKIQAVISVLSLQVCSAAFGRKIAVLIVSFGIILMQPTTLAKGAVVSFCSISSCNRGK